MRQIGQDEAHQAGHASPHRVLIAVNDAAVRDELAAWLVGDGFEVWRAGDGPAAIALAREADAHVIIVDVDLTGVDGYEVCRRLRLDPETMSLPIILLGGPGEAGDQNDVARGLEADDFIAAPFEQVELLVRVRSAVRLRTAMTRLVTVYGLAAALANAIEAKDPTTEHHCQRTSALAVRLGSELGLGVDELAAIGLGALLHDVGKIGVPEAVLNKPGKLTAREQAVLRIHPIIGERICRPLDGTGSFARIVRHHHERWDGGGYPDALRGDEIPIGARIVSLADAFDAITHDRPYREGRPVDEAMLELARSSGRQFDPQLVQLLGELIEREPGWLEPDGLADSVLVGLRGPGLLARG